MGPGAACAIVRANLRTNAEGSLRAQNRGDDLRAGPVLSVMTSDLKRLVASGALDAS